MLIIIAQQYHKNITEKFNLNSNKMYQLYHYFIQKIKQQQIQKYNQKHRAYLIRSGKLRVAPQNEGAGKNINNVNVSRSQRRQRPMRDGIRKNNENVNVIANTSTNQDESQYHYNQQMQQQPTNPQKQMPIQNSKPRRQREFNRPNNRNQQKNQQLNESIINNNSVAVNESQVRQDRSRNRQQPVQKFSQNFVEQKEYEMPNKFNERDRPIKSNKLTPQQIQYLNQNKSGAFSQFDQYNNGFQKGKNNFVQKNQPKMNKKPNANNQRPLPKQKVQEQLNQYEQIKLVECDSCGRKFKQQALQKHQKICQKVFQQKRKPFQVKATDQQAQLLKKKSQMSNRSNKQKQQDDKKQAKWKKQSQTFQNMIKRGRGEKVEVVEVDDRIQCPGCHRKFNQKAALKHIQFCTKKKRN